MDNIYIVSISSFLGLCASLASVGYVLIKTLRKNKAEQHYLTLLKGHTSELLEIKNRTMEDGEIDSVELKEMIEFLNNQTSQLSDSERYFVVKSLQQKSRAGRQAYTLKLFEKAGVPLKNEYQSR